MVTGALVAVALAIGLRTLLTPTDVVVERALRQFPVVLFADGRAARNADVRTALAFTLGEHSALVYDLRRRRNRHRMRSVLAERTGRDTPPYLFIHGRDMGAPDNVLLLARSGAIRSFLTEPNLHLHTPSDIVENAISDFPVVVFSKSYCPYCIKAKNAITCAAQPIPQFQTIHNIELDLILDGIAIQRYLAEKTGVHTVPQVFIGAKFVGGADDALKLEESGQLSRLIASAIHAPQPDAAAIVESAVTSHPVLVFSKSTCMYCQRAKDALARVGANIPAYHGAFIIELDLRVDGPEIQAYLAEKTHVTTVPQVFIAGLYVGGGDDMLELEASGELARLIPRALYENVVGS